MIYTNVEKKDFDRVQKLIDKNDDGTRMSKSIKDMNKAIRRYVVSRRLTGEGPLSEEDFRNGNYGKFSSFCSRAIELGASYFNIIINFMKPDDIPALFDWIMDEYLNEDQVREIMKIRSVNFHSYEGLVDYIMSKFIVDDKERERLAKDIYKVFLL